MLEQITCPADLRRLSSSELRILSQEIRSFIVDTVEANGGHLGSNLGVVELTIALHRAFDSPRDILLWDTGHQSYVHKILTGRTEDFSSLRKADGLSGYPSRAESEHDWIENSHASTALSYAGSNVIIVLNDNGRSYAPTISRLSDSLKRLRNNPRYLEQQEKLERKVKNILPFGESVEKAIEAAKAAVREIWDPTSFFENLGLRYNGPFDGHNVEELERAFRNAADFDGPTVIHVLTEKGRGYGPAENDPVKRLHDIGNPKPGSYTAAFTEALIKEAETRQEIVAITAAMPDSTGLLPFSERFPERFFDVGIAEQHATTAAAGMAMSGLRPVVAIYATFLNRAFDQIAFDVGLHELPVIFCLDRAGITGPDGASHHGLLDMMLMSKIPGMTLFAPSSYQELQQMFQDALEITDGPVCIRYPRTPAPTVHETEVGKGKQARKVQEGDDACILAIGKMLEPAKEAA